MVKRVDGFASPLLMQSICDIDNCIARDSILLFMCNLFRQEILTMQVRYLPMREICPDYGYIVDATSNRMAARVPLYEYRGNYKFKE